MKYLDGSEKTLMGINIGVLGFGIAFSLLLVAVFENMELIQKIFNKTIIKNKS